LGERGVEVVELRHMARPLRPWGDTRALRELTEHLRRIRPEILSTHSSKAGVLGRIAGRTLGIPTITTAHGWLFDHARSTVREWAVWGTEKGMAPLARRIVTVCESDRRLAIASRIARPERLVTIHNAMPDVGLELRSDPSAYPPRLLSIARFAPQKDHDTLLRALAELADLEWSLDLVGTGPLQEQAERQAASLGLSPRVHFLGLREDVPELLAGAQIYLLISNWEGFPRSILEAMRAGLPVAATDVGGVREAVLDGETGFVVPRGNELVLATRLRELISDPGRRARMGASAREHYESHFTFERLAEETLALYGAVLSEARGEAVSGAEESA